MKILLVLAAALVATAWAQSSLTAALGQLPTCAVQCIVEDVSTSTCAPTDQACICANTALQNNVASCVKSSCTIKEALFTKNVTQTACGAPVRNKTALFENISISFGVVAAVFVLLRWGYKLLVIQAPLSADDWAIMATIFAGIPSEVLNVHGLGKNGLGKDVWTLSPQTITSFGKFFWIEEILYFAQVSLLKLALLLFYLRIFPAPHVRRLLWGTVAFDCIFGIVFIFLAIFQCKPMSFNGTKWDGEHKGTCLDVNALGWSNACISIALDVWMLAIPLWQLKSLQLNWKKKVGVAMMFVVGTFVTVVSIVRLQSLVSFANSENPTWDQWDVSNWSTIEITFGIMCTCMPSLRLVLVRLFPKIMGSSSDTAHSNAKRYYHSRGGSKGGFPGHQRDLSSSKSRIVGDEESLQDIHEHDQTDLVRMTELDRSSTSVGKDRKSVEIARERPLPDLPPPSRR